MTVQMKLSKRKTLLARKGERFDTGPDDIFKFELMVFEGNRHLAGTKLAGQYDRLGYTEVLVTWQGDSRTPSYAPRISFDLESTGASSVAAKVVRAVKAIRARHEDVTRDRLIAQLGATVVEYSQMFTYRAVA